MHSQTRVAAFMLIAGLCLAEGDVLATPSLQQRPVTPRGALAPDELLLIYNQDDPLSRELAEHYAKVRSVPADRLCPVRAASRQDEISRELFDRSIRRPVREFLEGHDFGRRVRCLVLFYGLPLRVPAKKAARDAA